MKLFVLSFLCLMLLVVGCTSRTSTSTKTESQQLPSSPQAEQKNPSKCKDGTVANKCSSAKPQYCNAALQLVDKASLCGCPNGYDRQNESCAVHIERCNDGTPSGSCTSIKPNYCNSALQIIANTEECGCEAGYEIQDNSCVKPTPKCSDGTPYGNCSLNKPVYCDENGDLINKSSQCGCDSTDYVYVPLGETCRNYYWKNEGKSTTMEERDYNGATKFTINHMAVRKTSDKKIFIIDVTIENVGKKSSAFYCLSTLLVDSNNREFDSTYTTGQFGGNLNPGMKTTGLCAFETPLDVEPYVIWFRAFAEGHPYYVEK